MMNPKSLLATTFAGFALTAAVVLAADGPSTRPVAAPTTAPTTAPGTRPSAGKPINKFCAVNTDDEVDPKVTVIYKGKVIGFCCRDCIPEFQKDPEKYMAGLK